MRKPTIHDPGHEEGYLGAIVDNMLFRCLIENSTDILVVINGEGDIVYSSPSIEKYFGITLTAGMKKNAFEYIHPDDISRLGVQFLDVLEAPGKPFPIEARAQTKDGQPVWVEGVVTNLLETEGVNGIVCNFRDITERKIGERLVRESEELSRKLEHELTEEKILRQKQVMQATIDAQEKEREEIGRELHDNVNQILTTARLYLDCINDIPSGQQHIIQRSSQIITKAIEEIRKLSKSLTQSFQKEIGLKLSIEDLVENIRRLEEGLRVTLDFSMSSEELLDDKLKTTIFRILQEQLNNILKHAEASEIHIVIIQQHDYLHLQITDNGKGFDIHEKRKGIGINNIISRAEVFNGQVTVDSAPGKGCSMSIHFMLNEEDNDKQE